MLREVYPVYLLVSSRAKFPFHSAFYDLPCRELFGYETKLGGIYIVRLKGLVLFCRDVGSIVGSVNVNGAHIRGSRVQHYCSTAGLEDTLYLLDAIRL